MQENNAEEKKENKYDEELYNDDDDDEDEDLDDEDEEEQLRLALELSTKQPDTSNSTVDEVMDDDDLLNSVLESTPGVDAKKVLKKKEDKK